MQGLDHNMHPPSCFLDSLGLFEGLRVASKRPMIQREILSFAVPANDLTYHDKEVLEQLMNETRAVMAR